MEKIKKLFGFRGSVCCKNEKELESKNRDSCSSKLARMDTESSLSADQLSNSNSSETSSLEGSFLKEKQTLVLDLDETLVHTQGEIPDTKFYPITIEKSGQFIIMYVIPRPGLLSFMEKMSAYYNICIYTCGDDTYAKKVASATGINKHIYAIYSRNSCKKLESCLYQKDLWSLGFNPQDTIFVDDFSLQTAKHCENSIQIKAFEGASCDRELKYLARFLKQLHKLSDVRPISKYYDNYVNGTPAQNKYKEDERTNLAACEDFVNCQEEDTHTVSEVRVLSYNKKFL